MTVITIDIEIDDCEGDGVDMSEVWKRITGEIGKLVDTLIKDTGVDVNWDYVEHNHE